MGEKIIREFQAHTFDEDEEVAQKIGANVLKASK